MYRDKRLIPGYMFLLMKNASQKVRRAYLHLRPLHRVVVIFPLLPHHSLNTDLAGLVQTIQVGIVAPVVPPAASIVQGTATRVLGGKFHTTMITKRIPSSA